MKAIRKEIKSNRVKRNQIKFIQVTGMTQRTLMIDSPPLDDVVIRSSMLWLSGNDHIMYLHQLDNNENKCV